MPELALGIIAIISAALYAREYHLRKKQNNPSSGSKDESDVHGIASGEKTLDQLEDSIKKSREFLSQAETDSMKLVSDEKFFAKKAEQDFAQILNDKLKAEEQQSQDTLSATKNAFEKAEADFATHLNTMRSKSEGDYKIALDNFNAFLEQLKQSGRNAEIANTQNAQTRINELFENFETKLADFLLETEQKMMLAVDMELRSARQLIDTYKVQQMNLIDENIVAMLEKTLALVLAKNLNLKDQMDLVYESLEKAKVDKFIV